jgi:hypothetical protein
MNVLNTEITVPNINHSLGNGFTGVDVDKLEVEKKINSNLTFADILADEFLADVYTVLIFTISSI